MDTAQKIEVQSAQHAVSKAQPVYRWATTTEIYSDGEQKPLAHARRKETEEGTVWMLPQKYGGPGVSFYLVLKWMSFNLF